MNKNYFKQWMFFLLLVSSGAFAQVSNLPDEPSIPLGDEEYYGRVGVNTEQPKATLHISEKDLDVLANSANYTQKAQGVLFPQFTTEQRNKFTRVSYGTMIYNSDEDCIEVYKRNTESWVCLCDCNTSSVPPPLPEDPVPSYQDVYVEDYHNLIIKFNDNKTSGTVSGVHLNYSSDIDTDYNGITEAIQGSKTPVNMELEIPHTSINIGTGEIPFTIKWDITDISRLDNESDYHFRVFIEGKNVYIYIKFERDDSI